MNAQKLQLKIFAETHTGLVSEAFIPVFHRWIKDHVLAELMIDVANYAHVPKGPGVVLIGHACDYFIDESDGRFGLLHNHKRGAPDGAERLPDLFRRALYAASLLEQAPELGGKLRFSTKELLFRVNDRLAAPATDATFTALAPELESFAKTLLAGAPFELGRAGGPKALFSVELKCPTAPDVATLLDRLGGKPRD